MATTGALLKAKNLPLVDGRPTTRLTATCASGASTLTVENITGFAAGTDEYILLGEFGQEGAEIVTVHTSTSPSGSTITLNAATTRSHAVSTKVTAIEFNKVEFSRSATSGGSKSVLTTVDISPDSPFTTYIDETNSTGYWYYRYKKGTGATFGSYSEELQYSGFPANSVGYIKRQALKLTHTDIDGKTITDTFILDELNNWQNEITDIRNWQWLATSTTDTVVSGQEGYSVPTDLKYPHTNQGIIQMRVKNFSRLQTIDKREYDEGMIGTVSTTLAANVLTTDSTITLTDSSDFQSSGTITIGSDEITYTANDTDTNILTVDTDTIDTTHTSGDTVWQSSSLGLPEYFMVYEDTFYLYPVASATYNGLSISIDYYKQLSALTSDASVTEVPFHHIAPYFLCWKIMQEKGDKQAAADWKQTYESRMAGVISRDKPPVHYRFTLARP